MNVKRIVDRCPVCNDDGGFVANCILTKRFTIKVQDGKQMIGEVVESDLYESREDELLRNIIGIECPSCGTEFEKFQLDDDGNLVALTVPEGVERYEGR